MKPATKQTKASSSRKRGDAIRGPKPVPDIIRPGIDVLFVGINPGLISAREGHHFANPANGFWRLLHESGFTPRRLLPAEEQELLNWGLGITNLVSRESSGVSDLSPQEMAKGRSQLERTICEAKPGAVVFVGVVGYRAFFGKKGAVRCGEQPERIEGARVFVVPNPSGRNAHFSYAQMLEAFTGVARSLGRSRA